MTAERKKNKNNKQTNKQLYKYSQLK